MAIVDDELNSIEPGPLAPRPTVLGVGDFAREEFRETRAAIARDANFSIAATPELALECLHVTSEPPEIIVIAQPWPGRFTSAAIELLSRAAPLARIWALLGAWCDGESRSGKPWPGTLRAYWHQWIPRWRQELQRVASGQAHGWSLPLTATDEERMLAAACEPAGPRQGSPRQGLIVLVSRQAELAGALGDACRAWGYATLTLRPHQPPSAHALRAEGASAIVWDATPQEVTDHRLVQSLAAQFGGAPIVALLDFPRGEDVVAARAAGIGAVLAKPFHLPDLLGQLEVVGCVSASA